MDESEDSFWSNLSDISSGGSDYSGLGGTLGDQEGDYSTDAFDKDGNSISIDDDWTNGFLAPDGSDPYGIGSVIKTIGGGAKSVKDWLGDKANSKIIETILGGISAAQTSSSATDRQKLQNQGALDQLELRQKQKLEDNKRYSESVTGLRPATGLVGGAMQKLQKIGGANVFDGNGMLTRG